MNVNFDIFSASYSVAVYTTNQTKKPENIVSGFLFIQ